MEDDTGECLVGDGHCGGLAVRHSEIVGRGIQLVSLLGLGLQRVVIPGVQLDVSPAVTAGGHRLHQAAVHLPNFKGDAAQAFGLVRGVYLDELGPANGGVIDRDILGVGGVHLHRLILSGGIDHIAVQGFGLGNNDGAHDPGQADLAIGVGSVEALAGQMAVVRVHIGAVGVGQEELHPAQRFLCDRIQFFDDDSALLLVIKAEGLHLSGLDLDGFGRAVQYEPFHRLDLFRGNGGSGF